ncbi:hypothetical protein M758_1G180400 [Ceratodon purpureus]|nr:hypothetical protein M758_1G180400 [Ceratodon purpureus]
MEGGDGGSERARRRLMDLIEEATVSPAKSLDLGLLQSIKAMVRSSDAHVHTAFDALFDKLKKNHSQVRFLAVLLIDELFTRSKLFRSLLVPKFEMFMLLTIGYRDDYPLPKPPDRATLLRTTSMELVEKWNDSFGVHYKQVRLGYEYLKKTLRLQFPNLRAAAALAEQQRQEKEARTQALIRKKYESLCQDFSELRVEIQSTLNEIAECCKILEPEIVSAPEAEGNELVSEAGLESLVFGEDDDYEEYGDSSLRRQLHEEVSEELSVPEKPKETTDNSAVFESLRDLYKLVASSHLRTTQEWLSILMRVDTSDTRPRDALLKEVIDLRTQLLGSLGKCESLGIDPTERASTSRTAIDEVDDEDIIWEAGDAETDKDLVDTTSTSHPINIENDSKMSAPRNMDPASSSAIIPSEVSKKKVETGPRADLLEMAPVLPYGSFLDNWGSKSDVPANQRGLEMENHWGRVDTEAMIPVERIAEMNFRSSFYKPPEKEITPCRAPLKKGGLCPRRDLRRCPLHGPIIPRDENGNPLQTPEIDVPESKPAEKELLEVSMGGLHSASSSSMGAPSSISEAELAMQAIANVRERDEAEARKKRDERVTAKRKQSKRDREHNDIVLRAAALSQSHQGFQSSFGEEFDDNSKTGGGKKKARGGLTALLKKTPTAKERIAQRLLNSRVRDNAVNELARVEEARHRDAAANNWS